MSSMYIGLGGRVLKAVKPILRRRVFLLGLTAGPSSSPELSKARSAS
jgi:hypothetical protein